MSDRNPPLASVGSPFFSEDIIPIPATATLPVSLVVPALTPAIEADDLASGDDNNSGLGTRASSPEWLEASSLAIESSNDLASGEIDEGLGLGTRSSSPAIEVSDDFASGEIGVGH
jgi:hypothetical protein